MEVWILLSDAEHCRWHHLRLVHDPALVAVSYPQRYVGRGYGNTGDDRHYRGFPRVVQLWIHDHCACAVVPTISSVSATPVNDNSVISGWGIYVYGKSKAKLSINSAAGAYGSTIKSYSITTTPNVGS